MDVSERLYVCIKRTDVFYTLMDKATRILVSARCKGVNESIGPEFEPKPENSKKPKSLDTLKFKK